MSTTPLRPFGRKEPAAPLPDPKTSYERPLKRELAHRILVVCSASYGLTWMTYFLTSIGFSKGPPLGFFGHLIATSIFSVVALAAGALPPLILRGHAVSEKNSPAPTRGQVFMNLISSSHIWRILLYFATSGLSLAVVYVAWINLSEWEDSKLSVFAPTRRNSFRLNERFIYLAFFNASLGLMFSSRDIIRQRRIVVWPRFDESSEGIVPLAPTLMAIDTLFSLLNSKAIVSTVLITVIHMCLFPVWYHSLRAVVLPILRSLPVLSGWTRPMLHGFGRTWSVDVPWSRLIALSFKTSFTWELVECAFDYWVTKPISLSSSVPNPNQVIVAGLHSKDQYFRYHAYLELSSLARSSSPAAATRRTALFTDTKTNPTLWAAVVRELLLTLGQDYQCLIRRGKPPPPAVVAPASSVPRTPKTPATPLLQKPILKPSPQSFFDPLASDGAVTQALSSMATLPKSVNVPSVFLPSPSTPRITKDVVKTMQTKTADVAKVAQTVRGGKRAMTLAVLSWAERQLPRDWKVREWWTDVSVEKETIACLPNTRLDIVAIEALTHLIAASLKEDTFGTVQRDIPCVLEALTSFLAEVERYHADLEKKLLQNGDTNLQKREIVQDRIRAIEVVVSVMQALRSGIVLIVKTFGDRLSVYKFPPVTADRLQPFVDYL